MDEKPIVVDRTGTVVTYFDELGVPHDALVTADWGWGYNEPQGSINVVYVTTDKTKQDPYGLQLERDTSVVHKKNQGAHGRYWVEK